MDVLSFVVLVCFSSTEPVCYLKIQEKGIKGGMVRDCYRHPVIVREKFFYGEMPRKGQIKKTEKKTFQIREKRYVCDDGQII